MLRSEQDEEACDRAEKDLQEFVEHIEKTYTNNMNDRKKLFFISSLGMSIILRSITDTKALAEDAAEAVDTLNMFYTSSMKTLLKCYGMEPTAYGVRPIDGENEDERCR